MALTRLLVFDPRCAVIPCNNYKGVENVFHSVIQAKRGTSVFFLRRISGEQTKIVTNLPVGSILQSLGTVKIPKKGFEDSNRRFNRPRWKRGLIVRRRKPRLHPFECAVSSLPREMLIAWKREEKPRNLFGDFLQFDVIRKTTRASTGEKRRHAITWQSLGINKRNQRRGNERYRRAIGYRDIRDSVAVFLRSILFGVCRIVRSIRLAATARQLRIIASAGVSGDWGRQTDKGFFLFIVTLPLFSA